VVATAQKQTVPAIKRHNFEFAHGAKCEALIISKKHRLEYEAAQNGVKLGDGGGIICLPGCRPRNIICPMAESNQAPVAPPAELSPAKVIIIRIIALTAISLALIFAQGWAAPRYYQPDYVAGFYTGLLEGALMPAALPGLVGGKDVPIYAPNNEGRSYKIGYILGLNTCGTIFFGVAFWQPRRKKSSC
jgi:hypothetical protein